MNKYIKLLSFGAMLFVATFAASAVNAQTANAACVDNIYSYSLVKNTCAQYIQILSNGVYASSSQYIGSRTPLVTDGIFGAKTKSAITNIQAHANVTMRNSGGGAGQFIYLAKDGVVGRQTWAVLCTYSNIFVGNPNFYVRAASGCTKSDGSFSAFDYFYSTGITSQTH